MEAESHQLRFFSTQNGMLVRTRIEEISTQGRATQGVRLVNLKVDDRLIGLASIPRDEEEEVNAE